jgi:hypothetical protein
MSRAAAVPPLLLAFALAAHAAPNPGDPIFLPVSPADFPKPSLKHRLLPDPRDLTPGNAAAQYYRAFALFAENRDGLREIKESYWYDWAETPPDQLPKTEVQDKLHLVRHFLHEIEVGAGRKECDWQLENRSEGIGLILPEVQSFRNVGALLAVRIRLAVAEGRFDDAVHDLQTGYALAHHLGKGPTLIHVLVGGAIAGVMDAQLDELLRRPGAPNLYWALTELPRQFLDPEPAVEEDARMVENMFPFFKRLDGPPMSDAEVQNAVAEMRKRFDDLGLVQQSELDKVAQAAQLIQAHGDAKRRLQARGRWTAEQVEAMPMFQAVALSCLLDYRDSYDEMAKWAHAPNGFRHPGYKKSAEQFADAAGRIDRLFFRGLLRDVGGSPQFLSRVYGAGERVDRRFAALTCVEALRQYAARNGKWPDTLDDVTDVPVPVDPVTGKPFEYKVQDDVATLATPPVPGVQGSPPSAVKYELTLRK